MFLSDTLAIPKQNMGAALVDLLGGMMDFNMMDAFWNGFGDGFNFGAHKFEWCEGSRNTERTN